MMKLVEEHFKCIPGNNRVLTDAERLLLMKSILGDTAFCGPTCSDEDNDPEKAASWPADRNIGAELIRWLCVDQEAKNLIDPRGIQIYGAHIVNSLDLVDLPVPFALVLKRCVLEENASFYGLEANYLELQGTWLKSLDAQSMRIKGNVFLLNCYAEGEVNVSNSQIGGDLYFSGSHFVNQGKNAIVAAGIGIGGSIRFDVVKVIPENCPPEKQPSAAVNEGEASPTTTKNFRAEGQVWLEGARIAGSFYCDEGAEFANQSDDGKGIAIWGVDISVKGTLFLRRSQFHGEVRLVGAQIGDALQADDSKFLNPRDTALNMDDATIGTNVILNELQAEGKITLDSTHVGGEIIWTGADFSKADLDLTGASARALHDSGVHWPQPDKPNLYLNGFTYQELEPQDAKGRLRWLERQPEPFYPQPYLQLAKVLGNAGDDDGKVMILVAMKDKEWAVGRRGIFVQLWRWPFKITAGYGYDPIRALWEILGLSALGWAVYRRTYLAGKMSPTEKDAYTNFKNSGQPPDHHPKFSPLIYSLENSLPLVKLGQGDKWEPDPSPTKPPAVAPTLGNVAHWPRWLKWLRSTLTFLGLHAPEDPTRAPSRASGVGTSSKFVRVFLWVQILLGWLLATLFLAGISGIIKKE